RDRARADARAQTANEVVNAGEVLMGLFFGRRRSMTSVASKRQRTMRAQERVGRLDQEIAELEREVYDLEAEIETELGRIDQKWEDAAREIEVQEVRLERDDIRLEEISVLWVPVTRPV